MRLYFITNQPELAKYAWQCGVDRLFVDLEYIGKEVRQPGFQRVISHHSIADVQATHEACPEAKVLARINPLNASSEDEIDACIKAGASVIMLPMFRSMEDLEMAADIIAGRAVFCPLIETWEAVAGVDRFVCMPEVDEFHFGLTDLSLAKGYPFVFQPWANGLLENAFAVLRQSGKPFGVGGVARVGQGLLPGEMVMGEHVRVGSTAAMLSQAFHYRTNNLEEIKAHLNLQVELDKLRSAYADFHAGSDVALQDNRKLFVKECTAIGYQMSGSVL